MKPFTMDQIPKLIRRLYAKMEDVELLLLRLNPMPRTEDDLLNVSQAAELLHLSVATLYSKVSRNEIPFNKVGKKLYFYRSELDEWIRSGRVRTALEIRREVEEKFRRPDDRLSE